MGCPTGCSRSTDIGYWSLDPGFWMLGRVNGMIFALPSRMKRFSISIGQQASSISASWVITKPERTIIFDSGFSGVDFFVFEILQFEFMQNAVIAGLLTSVVCGIIGTLVVVNRVVFLSGGIAHAAYGGIGLSFFFGLPYLAGTIGFTLAAALLMTAVMLRARHRADTIIGVMWAAGMAVGVIFLDLTPGYNVDLMSYLFGSILVVPQTDLWAMTLIGLVVIGVVGYFYNDFLAMSYDEEFARLRGVRVSLLYYLLFGMIAVSIVVVIRVVGLILVIALLTIPPYIAEKHARSLLMMMGLSCVLSCLFTLTGLWLSYLFDLTSGATIIMVGAAAFFLSMLLERFVPVSSDRRPEPEEVPEEAVCFPGSTDGGRPEA